MFLHRDFLIKSHLKQNSTNSPTPPTLDTQTQHTLKTKALEQLSMSRIKSRQMQFHQIELYLLASPREDRMQFYRELRVGLQDIINDEKAKKIVEDKWSHSLKSNVMGLFNRIAGDFCGGDSGVVGIFGRLYTETIVKLMWEDKLSRIQQKFLDCFLVQAMRLNLTLQILGPQNHQQLLQPTQKLRQSLLAKQFPKSLSNCQFLQYSVISLLKMQLPHQKYLYSHLVHAPNPKFLLPFRRRGVFAGLTNQILLKLSKVDMVGLRFWSYYEYEDSEVYPRIRRASGWEAKSQIMRGIILGKIRGGLEKYMNLINEKIKMYNNKPIDDAGINDIMSYVQICLQICNKKDPQEKNFGTALERVDLGQVFQQKTFQNQLKLKQCMIKLVQLYLKLLQFCPKKGLKQKFIQKISVIICKLIRGYNDQKFKTDITNIVLIAGKQFNDQEKHELIVNSVEFVNREWEREQERNNNGIAKVNGQVISYISEIVFQFGVEDMAVKSQWKLLKLEFFYILAINYKQNQYFESKKKLSMIPIDINHSLSNNQIFTKLQLHSMYHQSLRQHLRSIYQPYQLERPQHQGLLAIIDEVVSFRIQVSKENAHRYEFQSFFAMLVNFLEQSERIDPSGKLLNTVRGYFVRCLRTYMHDTSRLKFQDSGKKICIELLIKNVCFLTQGSISANPIISQFCQIYLKEYIDLYPQMAFHPQILTVLAQCISFLYRKSTLEYESKAQRLRYKNINTNILIPTKTKQITLYMIKLMTALYHIILHGHCINENYLKYRVLYLIKQNSNAANISFGWKYLKHVITNFKEDKEYISRQVLNNNSCAWFINQQFFCRRVKSMQPDRILLDKYLLPIHNKNCDTNALKKIFMTVQPQLEVEFLIAPPEQKEKQIDIIIEQLEEVCERIEQIHDGEGLGYGGYANMEIIEEEQNKLYEIVSRVKMAHINQHNARYMLSKILETCRKYNNEEFMKYVFLKVVPLLNCMTDNVLKSLNIAAQTLYYIVLELNNVAILYLQKTQKSPSSNEQDTFDIKTSYFDQSIKQYQRGEDTVIHYKLQKSLTGSDDKVRRFMIARLHHRRLYSLQKMYREVLKYISQQFHVFVAKGIGLMEFAQILKINFLIDSNILEFLSLESICYILTIHLQLVNIMKASVEKGQVEYNQTFIDNFYIKTLKIGLFHFQKKKTYYKEQLITKHNNIKSFKTKINFFIQICDYLRNDDFHRFRKKKLPKRDQLFGNQRNDDNLLQKILNYNKQRRFQREDTRSIIYEQPNPNSQPKPPYNEYQFDMTVLRYCLLYLISEQVDRIKAYSYIELSDIENPYSLAGKKKFINHEQIMKLYQYFGENCSVLIYNFVKIFGRRIDNIQPILRKIEDVVTRRPDYGFPEFLAIYIEKNKDHADNIKRINFWKPPNVQILFKYLSQQYQSFPYLQLYVTKVLSRLHAEQILFYLTQIYQTLTLSTGQIVYDFLLQYAKKSASFAHQLIWISKVQSKQERDPHNKNPRLPGVDQNLQKLCRISQRLTKDIIRQFTRQQKSFFKQVDQFYEEVTAVSGKLRPQWAFAQKKQKIRQQVAKIKVPKSAYLPTNPFFQVIGIKLESGTPMQSAAKCPFLLTFLCRKYVGPDKDFQKRKQLKSQNRYIDSDQQIQPILQEEMPSRLPIPKTSAIGSKVGKASLSKYSDNSESSVLSMHKFRQQNSPVTPTQGNQSNQNNKDNSYGNTNMNISLNNIRLDVSDIRISTDQINPSSRSHPSRKPKKNPSYRQKQKTSSTMGQSEISCIFKVFDDIRQDSLALQVIQLFMEIFDKNNLDLKLFPYKTISNRTGDTLDIGGIIQVVPKTVSRDSIGKTNQQSLYQFFISNFGPEYNSVFQEARQNFIKSQAAYSIVSYILQIKDRHNGNILINKQQGYIVHIDFGFIFDISPANNLRFERADFKLTEQMIKIMGGNIQSQPFQLYMNLVIKGFLIIRKYHEHVYNIIKLMYHSGLPCFLDKSLVNLQERFMMNLSQIEAAESMRKIILKAADHWTTNWYDKIQWIQQRIYH